MSKNEDEVPVGSPYSWSNRSNISLEDFLTKYRPSMVQNDGTKPWIWVRGSQPTSEDTGEQEAIGEASKLLREVTERVESIKNDASIPLRSNKKTGTKSKKEIREQVQAEASEKLREIATRHGYLTGKWLIFSSPDKVDKVWSYIATSLVSGPLSSTAAYLAKVATSPEVGNPNFQHVICIYLPDVYNKAKVTEVMKVLLRHHGLNLSGVKSDLYTLLGLDSKHPSGIPSTTWKNTSLMSEKEIKELKDAFYEDLASDNVTGSENVTTGEKDVVLAINKEQLNLTKAADNPFASEEQEQTGRAKNVKPKLKSKRKAVDDPFISGNEDDTKEKTKRKRGVQVEKKSLTSEKGGQDEAEKE